MTNIAKELLREAILTVSVCSGPYDSPHRCSALHCDHCGLCDASEDLIKVYNDYLVATLSQLEGALPKEKDIVEQTHQTLAGTLERLAAQHEAIGYNQALEDTHAKIKEIREGLK